MIVAVTTATNRMTSRELCWNQLRSSLKGCMWRDPLVHAACSSASAEVCMAWSGCTYPDAWLWHACANARMTAADLASITAQVGVAHNKQPANESSSTSTQLADLLTQLLCWWCSHGAAWLDGCWQIRKSWGVRVWSIDTCLESCWTTRIFTRHLSAVCNVLCNFDWTEHVWQDEDMNADAWIAGCLKPKITELETGNQVLLLCLACQIAWLQMNV